MRYYAVPSNAAQAIVTDDSGQPVFVYDLKRLDNAGTVTVLSQGLRCPIPPSIAGADAAVREHMEITLRTIIAPPDWITGANSVAAGRSEADWQEFFI